MSDSGPHFTHVYIPFDGVSDETKLGILDRLNAPNEQYGIDPPAMAFGPSYDNSDQDLDRRVPNHAELSLNFVIEKEVERAQRLDLGSALFIWAEGSVLQADDPSVRIIEATPATTPGDPPVVEEIRAIVTAVADVVNNVDTGNLSFEEYQDLIGSDGVLRD